MATKKQHTREFKENAVRLVLAGDRSAAAIARELGVPGWKLRAWVRSYQADQSTGKGSGTIPSQEELAKLRKENKQLRMENEILKKATAYFAKLQG
jgi:transposase